MRWLQWSSRIVGLALAATLVASGFTGCSGGGGPKVKRIIILTNGDSPFWDACRRGLQEAEKDLKLEDAGYKAVLDVNNGKPEGQLEMLRQYASQTDIAAVGVSALDAKNAAVADQLRELQKNGVHVITIDSDVDRASMRDARFAFIGTDNRVGGRELGRCAKGLLPGGGKWVAFVGRKGAQNAIERIEGFSEGAGDKFQKLDVMEDLINDTEARRNVRTAMTNQTDKGLNLLVGIWSYNAPAIADVVDEVKKDPHKREPYTVVTFDAEPGAIDRMDKGWIDVMVVQNPFEMGYQGVRLMKALAQDDKDTIKKMLPNQGQPEGDVYDTGLKVVVPDTGTPLKKEMFEKNTQFLTLSEFRKWLKQYNLVGS